ncbi:MAG TPA: substrate-binding domain-containing protein [Burkholderiales bacterium]|nr:substrate-binding domain-containing protein [Burkholderiales bacterium]
MTELRILSAGAVKRGVTQMAEAYARQYGTPVKVEFATAPELRKRITMGETADVLIAPPALMDEFAIAERIIQQSRRCVGRSRMGVVVHEQSAIKDVAEVEALKQMLNAAEVVVHNRASSGIYAAKLLKDLALAEGVRERVVIVDTGAAVMEYVAAHPAAIGLGQISEIRVLIDKGLPIRMAGPLPDAVQNVTRYEAAAVAGRAFEPAAIALAAFLATPEAKAVFTATGID